MKGSALRGAKRRAGLATTRQKELEKARGLTLGIALGTIFQKALEKARGLTLAKNFWG